MSISGTVHSKYFLLADTVFCVNGTVHIGDTDKFRPFRITSTNADFVIHVDMAEVDESTPDCNGYVAMRRNGNTFSLRLNPKKILNPEDWHIFSLIPVIPLLLERSTLILHASCVLYNETAILFSGPSGIGKSTQAQLWQQHHNALIINGDRCLIYEKDGVYYASSHLYCGSSGIAEGANGRIGAIVLLDQGVDNIIIHPSPIDAFQKILHQCAYEVSDPSQLRQVTDLVAKLVSQITVLQYQCRQDESSVIELEKVL
jgi:hypothetical protein